ncbi:MAG: UDP-N-acetylmuramate dehydrogenase [Eubacteriaceae bacterium]|nr:UDP-N-acetylmuramate dehydrogenase [Eubacteriaceae bacterium]
MDIKDIFEPELAGRVRTDLDMSLYTSFKTGGKADLAVFPESPEELQSFIEAFDKNGIDYITLGNCTNVLVSDEGIRGAVLFTFGLKGLSVEDNVITALSGSLMSETASFAARHSLSGMEALNGIPGSVGGGVYMNAGAYDGEVKNILVSVDAMDRQGNLRRYAAEDASLSYRHSIFSENGETIVRARFALSEGEEKEIRSRMSDYNARRREKQPLEYPSAGSTFKRPEGYYAGALIEQSGLKGASVGGAMVSEKHAGFIINKGSATSADILNLIEHVRETVYQHFGVMLEPEIKMIGRM